MALPLLAFLRRGEPSLPLRGLLLIAFGLTIVAVLATFSRGGFLVTLLVLALIFARLRLGDRALLATAVAACAVMFLMPSRWVQRMETITPQAPYVDHSGAKRVKALYVAYRVGLERPLLGAGFRPFTVEVFERYYPGYGESQDAHNHFLQVWAEHGFIGLASFVALLLTVLFHLGRLEKQTDRDRGWINDYAAMSRIAVIAFAAGGLFVNMPYYDVYLELVAVTVVLQELASSDRPPAPLGETLLAAARRRSRKMRS
jgi:probable O-glycosylation ligase (exosortase A-associated)